MHLSPLPQVLTPAHRHCEPLGILRVGPRAAEVGRTGSPVEQCREALRSVARASSAHRSGRFQA